MELDPTAVPTFSSTKETLHRFPKNRFDWGIQLLPPSSVRRIVPPSPVIVAVLMSTIETANKAARVPLDCRVQVSPPSVVRRMTLSDGPGDQPTAMPLLASTKETP